MKESDKLSKKQVNFASSNSDKNLLNLYKENKKVLQQIKGLKKKENLTDEDLLKLVKKYIPIPISIFKNSSPLESLVKYLKDDLNLTLKEISTLINRDPRTIWVTYNNARKKIKSLDTSSKITVPLDYFSERELSILENLVDYLIDLGHSVSKISVLLNRNYKTIYTIYTRIKEKDAK
ncbi:MAG: hypothetical protein AABW45_03820 [Nanoarchaeota archaeon]